MKEKIKKVYTSVGVSYDVRQKLNAIRFKCQARNVSDVIAKLLERNADADNSLNSIKHIGRLNIDKTNKNETK